MPAFLTPPLNPREPSTGILMSEGAHSRWARAQSQSGGLWTWSYEPHEESLWVKVHLCTSILLKGDTIMMTTGHISKAWLNVTNWYGGTKNKLVNETMSHVQQCHLCELGGIYLLQHVFSFDTNHSTRTCMTGWIFCGRMGAKKILHFDRLLCRFYFVFASPSF